jgi:molybdopterin-binding protein
VRDIRDGAGALAPGPGADHPLLEARGLVRRYGGRTVVAVESLAVRRGELLSIIGPNGSGKSTLFRLLLRLERPDAGTVQVGGSTAEGDARRRLAGVFQRPLLFTGTVAENVGYGLRARGVPREERRHRVLATLAALGMEALRDAPVSTLSGGEAQRVALARALALEPDVLLLDEPTASLDVSIRRRFRQDLERVGRGGAGAVVLITHDASEAFGMSDRVAVMESGRILQDAAPAEVMVQPVSAFAAELAGAELLLHGRVQHRGEGVAEVRLSSGAVLLAACREDGLAPGTPAVIAYRAEDMALSAAEDHAETSAVNRLPATVCRVAGAGELVRVQLEADGVAELLTAVITARSAAAMELAPGRRVTAHLKAAALHAWAAR